MRGFIAAALTVVGLAIAPALAAAQASLATGSTPFTSRLVTPTGRSNVTADAVAGINAMSTRPTPRASGQSVVRPDMQWVPDRYVSVAGAPEGVLVPGHWERRVSAREVHVPPLVVEHPRGAPQLIHGGVRPPADERHSP